MEERGLGYKELALLFEQQLGQVHTPAALMSRISRGTYTMAFFLELATVLGIDELNLTQYRPLTKKSK
jgi:hypothetical protein